MHKHFYLKYFLLAFIITLSVTYSNLYSQTDSIIIEHISTQEGLSNRHVHCIIEDQYGFLWIGTDDGLNRYDGNEFIVYKNNIWDTTSLSSPEINLLAEDQEGNIWAGTPNGLNLYNRHSDSFVRFTHDPENEYSISNNDDIEALLIDQNNKNYLWFGTDGGGLNLLDIKMQKFYNFKYDSMNTNSISGDKVQALYQDSFGYFWIGTDHAGLNRIRLNTIPKTADGKYDASRFNSIVFEHYLNSGKDHKSLHSSSIACIYEDIKNNVWILSRAGILIYDRGEDKLVPSSYSESFSDEFNKEHIHEMMEDRNRVYWFGAHSTLFQVNPNSNKLKKYILNKEGIRADGNQGLCEDNAGNIWAATWDGIVKVYKDDSLFEHFYHNDDDPTLPAALYTYSILADRSGKVWIGTVAGLRVMELDENGIVSFRNYFEHLKIKQGDVWSLVEDHNGSIWAVVDYTLIRIDPQNNLVTQYINDPENLNALNFQNKSNKSGGVNLLLDDEDNLWISAWGGGISKVGLKDLYETQNLNDVRFTNYFSDPDDPGNSVNSFKKDGWGNLWLCTRTGGVIRFNPQTEKFKSYKQAINNPNSLSINFTTSVHEDKNGNIWVGTYGGGLNKLDRESELFTHFGIKDGFPSDIIHRIHEDENGNLWISTNSGISKFNYENDKIRNYSLLENVISFHDTITGKMYFGNNDGFVVFHPDSIKESSYVSPIVFTKFTRFSYENEGEQIIDRTISAKDKIELSYKDDIISFEFVALSFNTNAKYEYAYKLEGLSNNWINLGTKREITFTNLDPGDYNFKVKACNQDGIWCDNFASIQIYISPPWWATWWSYVIYVYFSLVLFTECGGYELNRRKEKEDKKVLELENERKTKELEQARRLQLSMLPKEIPCLPNLRYCCLYEDRYRSRWRLL